MVELSPGMLEARGSIPRHWGKIFIHSTPRGPSGSCVREVGLDRPLCCPVLASAWIAVRSWDGFCPFLPPSSSKSGPGIAGPSREPLQCHLPSGRQGPGHRGHCRNCSLPRVSCISDAKSVFSKARVLETAGSLWAPPCPLIQHPHILRKGPGPTPGGREGNSSIHVANLGLSSLLCLGHDVH